MKLEQCSKSFFLYKKHPYLKDKFSVDKQLTFKRGHTIGELAHQLFPNGINVAMQTKNSLQAVELTKQLIESKTEIIYEATFVYNKVLVMIDLLVLSAAGYQAFEIKSSLKITDVYLKDACLQYFVLKNCLSNFEDFFIVTINQDYVLEDKFDVKSYFKRRSIKTQGEKNLEYFNQLARNADLLIEQNAIPNIDIGTHCFKPYQCDFFGSCWKNINLDTSVLGLPFISKEVLFNFHNTGKRDIIQLEENDFEKKNFLKITQAIKNNKENVDLVEIAKFTNLITGNFCCLDIEVMSSALPTIKGTKPFEQIPFLCSVYNGTQFNIVFESYEGNADDRLIFAKNLINQTKLFTYVLVFDKTLEVSVIKKLAELFSELKTELLQLIEKFVDVFELILNFNYYNPKFKGNLNLKAISSALNLDVTYSEIQSGLHAMQVFEELRSTKDLAAQEILKTTLVNYCNCDVKAVYELFGFFKRLIKTN